jgi:hypothetical protein
LLRKRLSIFMAARELSAEHLTQDSAAREFDMPRTR